jgi:hypothetical protein
VKDDQVMDWNLLALGIAEYRIGNAAAKALLDAAEAGQSDPQVDVAGIPAFYRAMRLVRLGNPEKPRVLAIAAAAKMKRLPADEQNPLTGDATHDDLILWLADTEATAVIEFEPPPPRGRRATGNDCVACYRDHRDRKSIHDSDHSQRASV